MKNLSFTFKLKISLQVVGGLCCRWEAPALPPFFHRHWKRANFHRGAAGLHIWVVVPSPSPKAMAHHRPPSQSRWPPSFFAATPPHLPTHSGHLTPWSGHATAQSAKEIVGEANKENPIILLGNYFIHYFWQYIQYPADQNISLRNVQHYTKKHFKEIFSRDFISMVRPITS